MRGSRITHIKNSEVPKSYVRESQRAFSTLISSFLGGEGEWRKKKGSKKGSWVKCVVKGSARWARTVLAWGLRDAGLPQPVTGNYLSYKHPGA